jgi:ABC-type multidrug transport system ATPase subunit/ABC-type multidrug transport system permease subunit
VVAARKLTGLWSGEVLIDGLPRARHFSRETAYVLQDQVLIPTLTVEETIRYSAWTKLPEGTTREDLQKRTELLLAIMGLEHVRNSRVGDAMIKGISGGQAKRLSIAVEIVSLPRLIFLDEPTSGLDSSIAFEVMSTMRGVITRERTCLCTIHQPSREIFALFDTVVLLCGGRLIYFGSTADAVEHFTQPELGFQMGGDFPSPAEFVIEISCGQRLPAGWKVPRQPDELEQLYRSSRFYRAPPAWTPTQSDRSAVEDERSTDWYRWCFQGAGYYATSSWTQLKMLIERTWVAKVRDVADMKAQVAKSMVMALLLGIVFYGAGDISGPFYEDGKLTSEARTVNSFLFFFTILCMFKSVHAIPYMCSRTVLYRRELASNAYGPLPYWLSSLITITPLQLFFHVFLAGIAYGMVGLNSNAEVFFYFLFATYAANMVSVTTAMALAVCAPSQAAALVIYPAHFLVLTMLIGYAVQVGNLPVYWRWASYIASPRWVFEGLMVNEWRQYGTDDDGGADRTGNGDVLADYDFDHFNKLATFWISLLFALGFAGITYWGLLPPANRLVRVADASDVKTIAAASTVTKGPEGAKQRKAAAPALKESLIEGGGDFEGKGVVDDPKLVHRPVLSVESYRLSTGAVERAQGCRLVFSDVHYSVSDKADRSRELVPLKAVTGHALPGEMVALMGASGAGKSTLLDVLAQRKSTGTVTGAITYNGSTEMTSSAYVMQDNVHMGILTVRESLYYAAELRLSERASAESKARRVQKIIDMLGLQDATDTILGTDAVRGVSGGQLKRVSIGVEIIHMPNLLFLDEPTTGLDSSISLEVMSAVRNLANQNRTVICTIHQPSEETYALFDSLLLLAEGRVIYFGPAATAVEYFTQSPYQFVCRAGANPADFVVAVAGSFVPAGDGRTVTGGELAAHYLTTEAARVVATSISTVPDMTRSAGSGPVLSPLPQPSDHEQQIQSSSQARRPSVPGPTTAAPPPARSARVGSDSSTVTADDAPRGTSLRHQLRVLLQRRLLVMRKDPTSVMRPLIRYCGCPRVCQHTKLTKLVVDYTVETSWWASSTAPSTTSWTPERAATSPATRIASRCCSSACS